MAHGQGNFAENIKRRSFLISDLLTQHSLLLREDMESSVAPSTASESGWISFAISPFFRKVDLWPVESYLLLRDIQEYRSGGTVLSFFDPVCSFLEHRHNEYLILGFQSVLLYFLLSAAVIQTPYWMSSWLSLSITSQTHRSWLRYCFGAVFKNMSRRFCCCFLFSRPAPGKIPTYAQDTEI